jgi:3'-phosphoadenosine 5'-phosphosulfate (PAPS) 3'-phosphatase
VRVIYYYWRTIKEVTTEILNPEVYLLSMYAKSDQSDMTAADRKAAKKFVEGLKDAKKQAGK